jgi:hypothetical protein
MAFARRCGGRTLFTAMVSRWEQHRLRQRGLDVHVWKEMLGNVSTAV